MTAVFRKRLAAFWLVVLFAQLFNLNGSAIQAAYAATAMELTVVTDQQNQTVSLPIYGTVTAVTVNWGSSPTDTTGPISSAGLVSHVYAEPGTYTIKIGGTSFTQFGNGSTYVGATAITGVTTFGTMGIKSLLGAFSGATNLTALPASLPSGVTSLKQMLQDATKFNQDVSAWNTSSVTDMSSMFAGATAFNQTVNAWNTANVTNFSSMFSGATAFNNGDASNIVSKSMATVSNQWSLAKATNLASMFAGATSFNQVVSGWNVSKVNDFSSIFSGATNFRQSVATWQPRAATNLTNFLHGGSWNTRTYDAILTAWAADALTAKSQTFDAGSSKYSSAVVSSVANLTGSSVGQFSWTITDGGQTLQKATRVLTWKVRPNDSVGATDTLPNLVAMDSEGGTSFTYSAAGSSSGVCSVTAAGRITIINVGDCTYTASIAEDAFALAATLTTTTVIKPVTPSEPKNVSATVSGRDITVSWTIPSNTGVTGIASYIASASAGGSEYVCTAQAPSLSCKITGVSRGTSGFTYSVTARAVGTAFRTDPGLVSSSSAATPAIVAPPLDRSLSWTSKPADEVAFGPISGVTAVDSLNVATPSYSIVSGSETVCSVNSITGDLTTLRAGMCNYQADVSADPDRRAATLTGLVKIKPFSPGPPTNITTSVNGRDITVSFTPPTYDGGYDIGKYIFTASALVNSFSCEAVAPATSCTITDTSRGESGFDYTITGKTQGADYDGKPGLFSVESVAASAHVDAPLVTELAWDPSLLETQPYGPLNQLLASETNGLGEVVYSIDSDSTAVCSVALHTGELTALKAGICNYRATILRSPDLFGSEISASTAITPVAPSEPIDVNTSVDGRRITITWSPPSSNGGVDVASYNVTVEGGGHTYSCQTTAPQSTCEVQDVSRGVEGITYSVTVTSTNGEFGGGAGLESRPSAAVSAKVAAPATRNIYWQYRPSDVSQMGTLPNLHVSGDIFNETPVYSIAAESSAICSVDSTTGELKTLHAGTCKYSVEVAADADYHRATLEGQTVIKPIAPTQPINVTTQVDGRNITISWDPPADDGGNGITSYRVDLKSTVTDYSCSVDAPATSCTIYGVTRSTAGVDYSATVTAKGFAFGSDASIVSAASDAAVAKVSAPIASKLSWFSAPGDNEAYGPLAALQVAGNLQLAAPEYFVDASSTNVCSVDKSSGELKALRVGSCKFRVEIAADADHSASSLESTTLISASKPSQPLEVTTQVNGRDITVTWVEPTDDGGNGLAGYRVKLAAEGQSYSCDTESRIHYCYFVGVSRGTLGFDYQAQVKAIGVAFNAQPQQISAWSEKVVAVVSAPLDRGVVWSSKPQNVEKYGTLPKLEISGDISGASPKFSISDTSAKICEVNQNSGTLRALRAGFCEYSLSIDADPDHFAALLSDKVLITPAPPSVPQNVKTVVDGRNLSITWDDPSNDGGNGIAGFNVKVQNGTTVLGCDTVFGNNSCQLPALDRGPMGMTYSVRVRAIGVAQDTDAAQISEWSQSIVALIAAPAARNLSWATKPDATAVFGDLPALSVSGDLSGLVANYYVEAQSAAVCEVDLASGALRALRAGLCAYSATLPADSDHQAGLITGSSVIKPAPPGAPKNVDAKYDGEKVKITWDPSTEDGGSEIVAYLATAASPAGTQTCKVTATETSCEITSIILGAHYEVSVQAINADIDQAKGAASPASAAAGVDIPAPPPLPTPEPTPTETPTPTPEPTATPTPEPTSVDARGLEAFDAAKDAPAAVAAATLNAVTLVSAAAAAAGAAGAAGAAAGAAGGAAGAAGGAAGAAGRTGGTTGGSNPSVKRELEAQDEMRDMAKAKSNVGEVHEELENWGDRQAIWAVPLMVALDSPFKRSATKIAPFSPLFAKFFIDGAYLRAMTGSLSVIASAVAFIVAMLGVVEVHGLLLPPPVWVIASLAFIGVIDVFAGLIGGLTLTLGLVLTAGVSSLGDARLLVSFFLISTAPVFMATAFRQIRRKVSQNFSEVWERISDYFLAPVFAAWASIQILGVMPALSGLQLEIGKDAELTVGISIAAATLIRIFGEAFAAGHFPARLASNVPTKIPEPTIRQKLVSIGLRAVLFAFVASAFVGFNWYLVLGDLLFITPTLLGIWQKHYPNSPLLYQIMPAGIPNLAFGNLLTTVILAILTALLGETPTMAQISFVLLPLPSTILSVVKLFGRAPLPGDVRWYLRPKMAWFYRIAGAIMFVYVLRLVGFIPK